ncbi:C-type lectin domain-containing protein [Maribacter arcticus]|uniref:C-type lectin domain-containing protein n=1 Tax=Maribacter arcticus TaxID=561365 RepID=UPI003003954B
MKNHLTYLSFFIILLCSSFVVGQETYLDNFSSEAYDNNDGTQNFAGDWIEVNDDDKPDKGKIEINNNQLRFKDLSNESLRRRLNLAGASSATLTFDYDATDRGGNTLLVQLWDGSLWQTVSTLNSNTAGSISHTLSANQISNMSFIRFGSGSGDWGKNDNIYIDNVLFTVSFDPAVVDEPPVLIATGDQIFCPGDSIPVVETISISDSDDTTTNAVYVQISNGYAIGDDLLTLTGTHLNITSTWDAIQGKITLSGPATYTEFETAVLAVEYSNSGVPSGTRQFSITVGVPNYLPSTGHYYEYVSNLGITWTDANAAANASTYYGLQGYLATLTSQDEADFSGTQAVGTGWIGATDTAVEGEWRWVTGPEAGTLFWNGGAAGTEITYAFWNSGEPNNSGGEDYAHITHPNINPNGSWNDLPNAGGGGNYQPQGYVVEYGGTPGDPSLNITDVTTITVDNIAPTASNPNSTTVFCTSDVPAADIMVVTDEADNCTVNPIVTFISDVSDGGTNPEIITRTYRITDDSGNSTDVFQTITVSPATITVQPSDLSVIVGNDGVFYVTANNTDSYQWQLSINGGVSFNNLTDGSEYSGTQTTTLTAIKPNVDKNGYIFRVIVSNYGSVSCTPVVSNEAILITLVGSVITNKRITYRIIKN